MAANGNDENDVEELDDDEEPDDFDETDPYSDEEKEQMGSSEFFNDYD